MSHIRFKRNCADCKEEFIAKTIASIFCSKKCYKRNWRKQIKAYTVDVSKKKAIIIKENLDNKHYLSIKEATIFFEISEVSLRRKIKEYELNHICLKNRFFYLKSDINTIL